MKQHLKSQSHKKRIINHVDNSVNDTEIVYFYCSCGKRYRDRSGLWRHNKVCIKNEEIDKDIDKEFFGKKITPELIIQLIEQNKELQQTLIEQNKTIVELASKSGDHYINNTTNNNNKTFNLQLFLNETCKDAINLTDFINQMQISVDDLEETGRLGYVEGISKVFLKNLTDIDLTIRPIHCNDSKRETIYIKDQDQWHNDSKELPENQKLKKAIKQIAHKNICMIPEWKKKYPDCVFAESRKSDLYNHIVYESMDHNEFNSEKIIKKIAKEVVIDSAFKKSGAKIY
jgi:hypothetical protein